MSYKVGEQCSVSVNGFKGAPTILEVEFRNIRMPGAMVRVKPNPEAEIERVMVMIHADFAGLMECAMAERSPITGDWEYFRRTRHPRSERVTVQAAAVSQSAQERTQVTVSALEGRFQVSVHCGPEVRVIGRQLAGGEDCIVRVGEPETQTVGAQPA